MQRSPKKVSAESVLKKGKDMEQTVCLSGENKDSSFTAIKILREQPREKYTSKGWYNDPILQYTLHNGHFEY